MKRLTSYHLRPAQCVALQTAFRNAGWSVDDVERLCMNNTLMQVRVFFQGGMILPSEPPMLETSDLTLTPELTVRMEEALQNNYYHDLDVEMLFSESTARAVLHFLHSGRILHGQAYLREHPHLLALDYFSKDRFSRHSLSLMPHERVTKQIGSELGGYATLYDFLNCSYERVLNMLCPPAQGEAKGRINEQDYYDVEELLMRDGMTVGMTLPSLIETQQAA